MGTGEYVPPATNPNYSGPSAAPLGAYQSYPAPAAPSAPEYHAPSAPPPESNPYQNTIYQPGAHGSHGSGGHNSGSYGYQPIPEHPPPVAERTPSPRPTDYPPQGNYHSQPPPQGYSTYTQEATNNNYGSVPQQAPMPHTYTSAPNDEHKALITQTVVYPQGTQRSHPCLGVCCVCFLTLIFVPAMIVLQVLIPSLYLKENMPSNSFFGLDHAPSGNRVGFRTDAFLYGYTERGSSLLSTCTAPKGSECWVDSTQSITFDSSKWCVIGCKYRQVTHKLMLEFEMASGQKPLPWDKAIGCDSFATAMEHQRTIASIATNGGMVLFIVTSTLAIFAHRCIGWLSFIALGAISAGVLITKDSMLATFSDQRCSITPHSLISIASNSNLITEGAALDLMTWLIYIPGGMFVLWILIYCSWMGRIGGFACRNGSLLSGGGRSVVTVMS